MKKDTVKIVVTGHVDHGKSTLIGRLLLDTNSLPEGRIGEIKKISRELGKEAQLAFLTDQLKEEREQDRSIDTTQIFLRTRKRYFVLIDTPGHRELLKNMISGATQAEAAMALIDINEGVMEQSRRHLNIIRMLGIENLIVVFNKMDLVNYESEIFEKVKSALSEFLAKLDLSPYAMVPVSAKAGSNVSSACKAMGWYKGPTLLEALESFDIRPKTEKRSLRLPIQDVYEMDAKRIIVGRIASGTLKERQKVIILPSFKKSEIKSISTFKNQRKSASSGENVGIILQEPSFGARGEVIVEENGMPEPRRSFKGNVFWMSPVPLVANKPFALQCATQQVMCIAKKIERRIDSSTLEILGEDAKELALDEFGIVEFETQGPIIMENFSLNEELGRFVIESDNTLQGAGIVATSE